MVTVFLAQSRASALMVHTGTPHLGEAHLRGLGHAVFLTQHVGLDLVEADRVGLHVLLVVRALGDPHVHDGQLQGGVGVGEDGDPLVGVDGRRVVEVGVDVDLLDADLVPEEEQPAGELSAEAPGRGLGVAAPHHHHVAVLADVVHDVVVGGHHADEALAPDVLGAPVPAFPAVGVADLLGEAAQLVQEQRGAAVGSMHHLALAVAVALHQDGQRPVLFADALDLVGDEAGGLVPGDAHVLALAPVLRVAVSALGVPVHPLQGVLDAVGRVGPLLVGQAPGGRHRLVQRLEGLAVLLDLPGIERLGIVLLVPVQRPDPDHLAVFDIHGAGTGAEDAPAQAQGLDDRLVCAFQDAGSFRSSCLKSRAVRPPPCLGRREKPGAAALGQRRRPRDYFLSVSMLLYMSFLKTLSRHSPLSCILALPTE